MEKHLGTHSYHFVTYQASQKYIGILHTYHWTMQCASSKARRHMFRLLIILNQKGSVAASGDVYSTEIFPSVMSVTKEQYTLEHVFCVTDIHNLNLS